VEEPADAIYISARRRPRSQRQAVIRFALLGLGVLFFVALTVWIL
jgi:hypothetical protein